MVDLLIVIGALVFLMVAAYRGYSVILCAPIAAMAAVLLTQPIAIAPVFSGLFMERMVSFAKLYLPVFLLGAVFGKLIELSGFSHAIVRAVLKLIGAKRAILAIVMVCALLTYGGVSLFVVVFAVYPFAAEMFRQSDIPKRLMPGVIALGAFTFTMTAIPGTPQIQNIIPTSFFGTTTWAAPWLGLVGAFFTLIVGMTYLEWRRRRAANAGEGYGTDLRNEPAAPPEDASFHPLVAILPLVVVGVSNLLFTRWIPGWYAGIEGIDLPGLNAPVDTNVDANVAIWAVMGALLMGILTILVFAFRKVASQLAEGSKDAVSGALLASMNTAAEYGFGGVIAALPGFLLVAEALKAIPDPLIGEAIAVTSLAGITGSASGGMSIALAAMADTFIEGAQAAGIPMEVLHRVAAMASGGMDTLPHNGAVITLLAVTGLTHRQSYGDIFAITVISTASVFGVIGVYYMTGLV
ncbi:GntP family permease [Schauerella aestuarii]|uniref:GntP family permease n=1 Tax=Schauerella aestuarii TaxID=2511204 RepID=UPI00136AE8A0|nr:GntP family permease [Achromobacter aestuarii]MYZ41654.1 GntP family permease [Achromobacter aestuarii]